MLRHARINGFRSLLGFRIFLNPGLNVIVGANGSGKSNFISFLDFLGTLIDSNLNSAIAVAQGAGSVFSKEHFSGTEYAEFEFHLDGDLYPLEDAGAFFPSRDNEEKPLSGVYAYHSRIGYDPQIPLVFIAAEDLTVVRDGKTSSISRQTEIVEGVPRTHVTVDSDGNSLIPGLVSYLEQSTPKTSPAEFLAARLGPERSLLRFISGDSPATAYVVQDLTRYRSVNIDPVAARKPTPVGGVQSLHSNGEYLAGALYHLEHGTYIPSSSANRFVYPSPLSPAVFESITSWCREVNDAIERIHVSVDFGEAVFKPYLYMQHGWTSVPFPFSRVSDGTVKWLALATVLFVEPTLSIIEEPENFLHPAMQETFIELCREAIRDKPDRAVVISTHSPTLLDCCKVSELILFEAVGGETRSSMVADRELLEKKLGEARFGLGYYYRSGVLRGETSGDS